MFGLGTEDARARGTKQPVAVVVVSTRAFLRCVSESHLKSERREVPRVTRSQERLPFTLPATRIRIHSVQRTAKSKDPIVVIEVCTPKRSATEENEDVERRGLERNVVVR